MDRALRRHNNERIMQNRFKLAKHIGYIEDYPIGKMRKRHPFDCGKSKCFICHSEKILYKNNKFKGFRGNYE